MANYIVEIGDEKGNSFRISISATWVGMATGSWRTLDKGYIRYNSGATEYIKSTGTITDKHILLYSNDNTWGIRLNDFMGTWSAYDEGTGIIVQPWVLDFSYGRISWALVE